MGRHVPVFVQNRRYWLILLALWTAAVAWSLQSELGGIRQHNQNAVIEGARNIYKIVQLSRLWNSQHGGVYVPIGEKVKPNPYLKHPRRDITDNFGRELTLINPAYMTRLIAELAQRDQGLVFRLASLKPISPENTPDLWERHALESFEQGGQEAAGFEPQGDGVVHRYMAPLTVVDACLQCHAAQGYKLGDIRGGISIIQSYAPFLAAARPLENKALAIHGMVFVLTIVLWWWVLEQLRRRWLELNDKIDEVELTREQLLQSEKMASLGRMVAGFAHEINTPIGVAVGAISNSEETLDSIDRMLDGEEVSEEMLREALTTLRQGDRLATSNLRRAANLVKSFKRTSIDQASEEVQTFSLRELIDDVLFALQNQLKRLPVSVTVDCKNELKIKGVPGLIDQLLTNFVMNSVVHGFADGERSGTISIRVVLEGAQVVLDYADTGVGMNHEVAARIFEPFFTTRRGAGGSGLGMYICYNIVTARLSGKIRCESEIGRGTRFLVEFPVDPVKPASLSDDARQES